MNTEGRQRLGRRKKKGGDKEDAESLSSDDLFVLQLRSKLVANNLIASHLIGRNCNITKPQVTLQGSNNRVQP